MNNGYKTKMIFAACALCLFACNGGRDGRQQGTAAYRTDTVTLSSRTLRSGYTATIRGYQTVEIRPQVSGQITDIRMKEGDAVRKDSVLFVIDQVPYKAAHDIAVANVKSAEAVLSTARLVLESNKGLLEEEVVSEFDLQTARNEVMEAEAVLQSSRLAFLPFVSLGGQGQASHSDGRPAQRTYSVGPSAEWELDIFGRQRNAKAGAKAALGQSRAYEQAMQTRLVATVADSYYTLLMLDEQLQISRRTLTTWQENIRTLSALKREGKTTEAAVLQARANKLEVEGSILTLEKRIGELENTVCALLGIAPVKLERGVLADQHFPDSLSAGLPLSLVGNRPDVREAEFALMQSFYATGEARSAFYPRITLSGTIGWTNNAGTISKSGNVAFQCGRFAGAAPFP